MSCEVKLSVFAVPVAVRVSRVVPAAVLDAPIRSWNVNELVPKLLLPLSVLITFANAVALVKVQVVVAPAAIVIAVDKPLVQLGVPTRANPVCPLLGVFSVTE